VEVDDDGIGRPAVSGVGVAWPAPGVTVGVEVDVGAAGSVAGGVVEVGVGVVAWSGGAASATRVRPVSNATLAGMTSAASPA
jgi:hypothetical protein